MWSPKSLLAYGPEVRHGGTSPAFVRSGLNAPGPDVPPVLLVDDVPADAAASRAILEGGGYRVVEASEGDAVLRLVHGTPMRCVISELYLLCSGGACVVAALKGERDRLPRLRVLVYTRHHSPGDRVWALAAGADGMLHKPASATALLAEVGRLDALRTSARAVAVERGRS